MEPETSEAHGRDIGGVEITIICMYTIISILSIVGNGAVLYLVLAFKRMRTVTNFFIASLACSDILTAVFCIPFTYVANLVLNYWPFGSTMCPIVTYLQTVMVFQSAFTLIAISLDRYVAISYPLMPRLRKKHGGWIIVLCWTVAFTTPLPTAITSKVLLETDEFNITYGLCRENWPTDKQRWSYSLVVMLLQYFIPLIVLIVTYARIVHIIWFQKTPGETQASPESRSSASKRKVVKMMITVVGMYSLCWLPLHSINIIGDIDDRIYDYDNMKIIWICAHWFATSHCCYNPFIYWWMNSRFHEGFKSIATSLFGCYKQPSSNPYDERASSTELTVLHVNDYNSIKGQRGRLVLEKHVNSRQNSPKLLNVKFKNGEVTTRTVNSSYNDMA